MDRSEALHVVENLTVWSKGDQRAPHKPLLILYALGCWTRGLTEIPYSDIEKDLTALLKEFGPPRRTAHPEQPFWRLQNDGLWLVTGVGALPTEAADRIPLLSELRRKGVRGRFTIDFQNVLRACPSLVSEIARMLLANSFPDSLHQDVLNAVGLAIDDTGAAGGRRDPRFRAQVLTAYEHRCAVCGFQVLLCGSPIAIDAAHIKWHQASGPAILQNGICLCVLHHKTFDLGVFTFGEDSVIAVSDEASGVCGFREAIFAFHGKPLRSPIHPEARPAAEFIAWHRREVFRGKPRPLGNP